jgi:hypothetical protein
MGQIMGPDPSGEHEYVAERAIEHDREQALEHAREQHEAMEAEAEHAQETGEVKKPSFWQRLFGKK